MQCPYCKSEVKSGTKFCSNCGQPVEIAMQESSAISTPNEPVISQAPPYGNIGQKHGPSRWFYALSALILVVGIASFVLLLLNSLSGLDKSLARIVVPGKYDMNLTVKGKYIIFYEYQSLIGDKVYQTGQKIPQMRCNVLSKATGQPVALASPSMSYSYSFGKSGIAVLEFTITQPGAYEIAAWYSEGKTGQEVVFAIGKGFQEKIMTTIFSCIAVLGGSIVLAIVIFIVTLIKRRRARQSVL
ncbi:MAG: zinc ribbon domain-containing protein [Proteobacteria bacterium]|nr:zinc ribbon domain-containing protein [Pseudomonadota bacterium]